MYNPALKRQFTTAVLRLLILDQIHTLTYTHTNIHTLTELRIQ